MPKDPFEDYPPEFELYQSQYQGRKEVQGWQFWDTVGYLTGVTVALRMFNVVRATLDLGNMTTPGQFPEGVGFLVRAINFMVKDLPESQATAAAGAVQPGAVDSVALLINTGVLAFQIGDKNYGVWPLWMLPAGGGAFGNMMVNNVLIAGALADWSNAGYPDVRNAYTLTIPIFIRPKVGWWIDLLWPAGAVATIRNVNLCVLLDGDVVRAIQ